MEGKTCIICNLNFTSQKELQEHSWSLLHHRTIFRVKGKDARHHCSLCDEHVEGFLSYTKHINSDKHRNLLTKYKQIHATKTSPPRPNQKGDKQQDFVDGKDMVRFMPPNIRYPARNDRFHFNIQLRGQPRNALIRNIYQPPRQQRHHCLPQHPQRYDGNQWDEYPHRNMDVNRFNHERIETRRRMYTPSSHNFSSMQNKTENSPRRFSKRINRPNNNKYNDNMNSVKNSEHLNKRKDSESNPNLEKEFQKKLSKENQTVSGPTEIFVSSDECQTDTEGKKISINDKILITKEYSKNSEQTTNNESNQNFEKDGCTEKLSSNSTSISSSDEDLIPLSLVMSRWKQKQSSSTLSKTPSDNVYFASDNTAVSKTTKKEGLFSQKVDNKSKTKQGGDCPNLTDRTHKQNKVDCLMKKVKEVYVKVPMLKNVNKFITGSEQKKDTDVTSSVTMDCNDKGLVNSKVAPATSKEVEHKEISFQVSTVTNQATITQPHLKLLPVTKVLLPPTDIKRIAQSKTSQPSSKTVTKPFQTTEHLVTKKSQPKANISQPPITKTSSLPTNTTTKTQITTETTTESQLVLFETNGKCKPPLTIIKTVKSPITSPTQQTTPFSLLTQPPTPPSCVQPPAPSSSTQQPTPSSIRPPVPSSTTPQVPSSTTPPASLSINSPAPSSIKPPAPSSATQPPAPSSIKSPVPSSTKPPAPSSIKSPSPSSAIQPAVSPSPTQPLVSLSSIQPAAPSSSVKPTAPESILKLKTVDLDGPSAGTNACEFKKADSTLCGAACEEKFCSYHQRVLKAVQIFVSKKVASSEVKVTDAVSLIKTPEKPLSPKSSTSFTETISTVLSTDQDITSLVGVTNSASDLNCTEIPNKSSRKRIHSDSEYDQIEQSITPTTETSNVINFSRFKKPRTEMRRQRSNSSCYFSDTGDTTTTTTTNTLKVRRFKYLKNLPSSNHELHMNNLPPTVRKLIERKSRKRDAERRNSQSESSDGERVTLEDHLSQGNSPNHETPFPMHSSSTAISQDNQLTNNLFPHLSSQHEMIPPKRIVELFNIPSPHHSSSRPNTQKQSSQCDSDSLSSTFSTKSGKKNILPQFDMSQISKDVDTTEVDFASPTSMLSNLSANLLPLMPSFQVPSDSGTSPPEDENPENNTQQKQQQKSGLNKNQLRKKQDKDDQKQRQHKQQQKNNRKKALLTRKDSEQGDLRTFLGSVSLPFQSCEDSMEVEKLNSNNTECVLKVQEQPSKRKRKEYQGVTGIQKQLAYLHDEENSLLSKLSKANTELEELKKTMSSIKETIREYTDNLGLITEKKGKLIAKITTNTNKDFERSNATLSNESQYVTPPQSMLESVDSVSTVHATKIDLYQLFGYPVTCIKVHESEIFVAFGKPSYRVVVGNIYDNSRKMQKNLISTVKKNEVSLIEVAQFENGSKYLCTGSNRSNIFIYEYGTWAILQKIDLHSGHVLAQHFAFKSLFISSVEGSLHRVENKEGNFQLQSFSKVGFYCYSITSITSAVYKGYELILTATKHGVIYVRTLDDKVVNTILVDESLTKKSSKKYKLTITVVDETLYTLRQLRHSNLVLSHTLDGVPLKTLRLNSNLRLDNPSINEKCFVGMNRDLNRIFLCDFTSDSAKEVYNIVAEKKKIMCIHLYGKKLFVGHCSGEVFVLDI